MLYVGYSNEGQEVELSGSRMFGIGNNAVWVQRSSGATDRQSEAKFCKSLADREGIQLLEPVPMALWV